MRVLVTGALGFVAPYVAEALRRVCGRGITLIGTAREAGRSAAFGSVDALDITDEEAVRAAMLRHSPTHVIHLAAIAAPVAAAADPRGAWDVHVQGTLNVARAALEAVPTPWLLHVGSGLVYGDSAKAEMPLDEAALLAPADEYAVTKAAADLAVGALAARGLRCVRMRPFNHTGAGQTTDFAVPAFAMQIARIEAGRQEPVIRVGNLEAERDFLDAGDVATAYALAVRDSESMKPGTIFNIASGVPRRIGDILERLLSRGRVAIRIEQDPARQRASDLPRVVGNACRAREALGWTPERAFDDTLDSVLADCRARVAAGKA